MSTIFVSYSSQDHALVNDVFVKLVAAVGYDCWVDRTNIRASERWKPSIAKGLECADWFLVIVSKAAGGSEWVRSETQWALENLAGRVIPVVVDGSDPAAIDPRLLDIERFNYGSEPVRTTAELVKLLVDAKHGGFGRDLAGDWLSAVQPVYYASPKWHIQAIDAVSTSEGYRIGTLEKSGKLQWRLDARFFGSAFLSGPWRSMRPGSVSQGHMTLQIARNGTYMCGHDYALPVQEGAAHFGILLLARNEALLEDAWRAMRLAQREMRPLSESCEFD